MGNDGVKFSAIIMSNHYYIIYTESLEVKHLLHTWQNDGNKVDYTDYNEI